MIADDIEVRINDGRDEEIEELIVDLHGVYGGSNWWSRELSHKLIYQKH